MKQISIDIETYSSVNLAKAGVYRYAASDDFELLLFSYSIDEGPVKIIDLTQGETIPQEIVNALSNQSIIKSAFNAQFERVCLSAFLSTHLKPQGWHCSMVWSATLGLPLSLKAVGTVLGLDKQKLEEGKDLVRYFCTPCKPTQTNHGRTRNLPYHDPAKWQLFKQYNQRDVEVEVEINQKLSRFPVQESEWHNYWLDQEINDCGIMLDQQLVTNAINCDQSFRQRYLDEAHDLTGLDNPNSPTQLKEWLHDQSVDIPSLAKADVTTALKSATGNVRKVLLLRQQLSKSSVKKYTAMQTALCPDGRVHGLLQFYGANRTSQEQWRQDVFEKNGDIYCESASQMFHVPVVKHGINGHLRQKGKIAELALGYGGSVGALKAMGALNMGVKEEELQPLVDMWRQASPNIVQFWWDVDKAAKDCIKQHLDTKTHGIRFKYRSVCFFIFLPSGRRICYVKPKIGTNRFGNESITYEGIGPTKKWERLETYGAKLVENIVQATSRDLLTNAMQNLNKAGYDIVMHIHDEVVIEAPTGTSLDRIEGIMATVPDWAKGLKLNAAGFISDFYKKD